MPHEAASYLSEAYQLARSLEPTTRWKVEQLRLLVASLSLIRRSGLPPDENMIGEVLALYNELGTGAVRRVPGLLRDLAAEVGPYSPHVIQAALRSVGVSADELTPVIRSIEPTERGLEDLERGELGMTLSRLLEEAADELSEEVSGALSDLYAVESDAAIAYEPEDVGAGEDRPAAADEDGPGPGSEEAGAGD
jgi:hypothetical protein